MIPYEVVRRVFCAFLISAFTMGASKLALAESKLNLILILADDLGYGDLSVYNPSSKIPTPYLDQLAAQGMRFTDAHSPSSVCTPTRYGILTGRYAWRTKLKQGVLDGYSPFLIEKDRVTLPSLLRRQGYRTAGIGKWHLGLGDEEKTGYSQPLQSGPNAAGFDEFFGIPASLDMPPYLFFENERVVEAPECIHRCQRDAPQRRRGVLESRRYCSEFQT